jgi:hypothetical protein
MATYRDVRRVTDVSQATSPGNDAGSCDKPTGVDTNTDDPQNSKENPAGKGGAKCYEG